jgi:methyl-accepting chemotaxis protein
MRRKLSLAQKLAVWGIIMAMIVTGVSLYSMYRLSLMKGYADQSYKEAMIPLRETARFVIRFIMTFATVQTKINDHIAQSETERMTQLEAEITETLNSAGSALKQVASGKELKELEKQWEGIAKRITDAAAHSRAFRKFEALSTINSSEGLEPVLALNKKLSLILSQAVKRAEDYHEASQVLGRQTKRYMIVACVGAIFLSVVIGMFLARAIGRPLRALSDIASVISQGDLRVDIPERRGGDEISTLEESFRRMVSSLRNQSHKTLEVVQTLSSLANQLSVTTSELAQNASSVTSAFSQVTATVAETSESAQTTTKQAKNVADTAAEAMVSSVSGREATQQTIGKMNLIREQMQTVAETVVTLSNQTQAIDDIIGSVQDLADQSRLLAVNASIEAARAGDHGKGFQIVAHEIKTLADQSKDATDSIRGILQDIRKWVSAVVMATEQGSKAVESGVHESRMAGESIESLVTSVSNSAQAASIIRASSEQQLSGMEQSSNALVSIEEAMNQNLEGASRVEGAAKDLQQLGEALAESVKYYKL